MPNQKEIDALTPADSIFAVIVIEETRALIEQVAAWARERPPSSDKHDL